MPTTTKPAKLTKPKPKAPAPKLTYSRTKWIDDASLVAIAKRAESTLDAPKDFASFVPVVRPYDDGTGVAVSLCGPRGRDREMILDREVWEEVSVRFDRRCFIAKEPAGEFFVATVSTGTTVKLAEHIMGEHQGQKLLHGCRDILDLRKGTMRLVPMWKYLGWEGGGNRLPRREAPPPAFVDV